MQPLADAKTGLAELVDDPLKADWLVRLNKGKVEFIEASGNHDPFPLPPPESPALGQSLRQSLEKVYRARNLVNLAGLFEKAQNRRQPRGECGGRSTATQGPLSARRGLAELRTAGGSSGRVI